VVGFRGVLVPGGGVVDAGPGPERDSSFRWLDVMRRPANDAAVRIDDGELPMNGWFAVIGIFRAEPTDGLAVAILETVNGFEWRR